MIKLFKTLLLLIVIGILVFLYATFLEPKILTVTKHDYSFVNDNSEKNSTTINIAHFTDTQIGEFFTMEQFEKVVTKLNELKPDMIIFTGDLFDLGATEAELQKAIDLLSKLKAPYGKFAIYGNRDVGGGMIRNYERVMSSSNFKLLINDEATVTLPNNKQLLIYGLDDGMLGHPDWNNANNVLSRNEKTLFLLHEPDLADKLSPTENALFLAGHSHGGQVHLPFIGPLVTTALGEKYVKGWYTLADSSAPNLFVNTGLGNTKLPFRFGNLPQISLISIHL